MCFSSPHSSASPPSLPFCHPAQWPSLMVAKPAELEKRSKAVSSLHQLSPHPASTSALVLQKSSTSSPTVQPSTPAQSPSCSCHPALPRPCYTSSRSSSSSSSSSSYCRQGVPSLALSEAAAGDVGPSSPRPRVLLSKSQAVPVLWKYVPCN